MLISTWIGTELVNINEGLAIAGITGVSAYGIFIDTIPYRFYNILALFFVFATAFLLRDFGPMLKAEMRARTTGETINPGSEVMDTEKVVDEEKEEIREDHGILKASKKVTPPNIWNAIIPVAVLIISAVILFYTNGAACIMDGGGFVTPEEFAQLSFFEQVREAYSASDASIVLFQAGLLACIVALIMGFVERIFTLKDGIGLYALIHVALDLVGNSCDCVARRLLPAGIYDQDLRR